MPSPSLAQLEPDVVDALHGLGPLIHGLSGKRVLVTGARGYLGRYVVAALVLANRQLVSPCHIYAMDSFATGVVDKREDLLNVPNLTFVQHGVQHDGVETHFTEKLDFVWHLAGIASPFWYAKLPLATIDVAVQGTSKMLELARKHGAKFLFTSSSELYQTANIVPTPESYIGAVPSLTERSCYDVSKLLGETLCYVLGTHVDRDAPPPVHVNIVRIFNSFGVGMAEHDRRILTCIANSMVRKRGGLNAAALKVFAQPGGRLPTRTYTPVANTLTGFLRVALTAPPMCGGEGALAGVFNVGLDSPELTVPELCGRITHVTGEEVAYEFVPRPENYATEPLRRCPDVTKLRALGWKPVVELDEGLRRFFRWALEFYTGEMW